MSEPDDTMDMSCPELAEVASELALGVLTGRERAVALAHLDGCESCRELVRQLTMTGSELLALLPSREPPPGFETRVLERIGLSAPASQPQSGQPQPGQTEPKRPAPGPRRGAGHRAGRPAGNRRAAHRPPGRASSRMRSVLGAVAVALAVVGAGLGGWGLRAATAPPAQSGSASAAGLSTAALVTADHQAAGAVFVYNHAPWWLYMSVSLDGVGDATVKCQLENSAGQFTTVGKFRLSGGYGSWASPFASHGPVIGARLLSANGTVLASATFS
jgi:hypothetical protein